MSQDQPQVRRIVDFFGRVQGVGFRYTALRTAAGFALTGYVENQPDGRVRLVVEGAAPELARFIDSLESRMRYYIATSQTASAPATGEFPDFRIRH